MKAKRCFTVLKDGRAVTIAICILFLVIGFMVSVSGCSSGGDSTTNAVIGSAVSTDEEGTVATASVTDEGSDIENAIISVNEVTLTYGLPVVFRTEEGIDVNVTLPIYYADLNQFTSGDRVDLVARTSTGALIYNRSMVTIPGKPTLVQPTEGQVIGTNEDVPMQWNTATDVDRAEGYVAGYVETGAFDEESTNDDDTGIYAEYVGAPKTEMTVPSAYTVVGDAIFSVTAVSGDTDIFTSEEDPTDSFLVAGASDWIEAEIATGTATQLSTTENQVTEDRGSQGLKIAKQYSKKIKGYRFKIRESDPNQISASGTVQIGFKMRRYKVSIAFVRAFDMNGNQYYSWEKKRIYKSKKYSPSFSVSVGTTIVFGTHDASYRGGTYTYADERPVWIRFFIGTDGMGVVKCGGCSTAAGCNSLWIPAGSFASCQASPPPAHKFLYWTANGNYAGDNPKIRFGTKGAILKGHFSPN